MARLRWDWKEGLRRRSGIEDGCDMVTGVGRAMFEEERSVDDAPNVRRALALLRWKSAFFWRETRDNMVVYVLIIVILDGLVDKEVKREELLRKR